MNEENRVLVGCVCGYRTTTYTLEDVHEFEDDTNSKEIKKHFPEYKGGMPSCPYCGEILVLLEKQYKEL